MAFACFLLAAAAIGCGAASSKDGSASPPEATASSVTANAPLAESQRQLLALGFDAASAIPLQPHAKDRSRAQEAVVEACLVLGQPRLALEYLERIEDWRRGAALADVAFHLAGVGDGAEANRLIERAQRVALDDEDWRRDAILSRIAQTLALLRQNERAAAIEETLMEAERGKSLAFGSGEMNESEFETRLQEIEALAATGSFDLVSNSLAGFESLYRRSFANPARRERAERGLRAAWVKMPALIKIERLATLADIAADHGDTTRTLELAGEADDLFGQYEWPAEVRPRLTALVAGARFRGGEREAAHAALGAALQRYELSAHTIADIWRAGSLRPLAEAYQQIGDAEAALAVYRMAVEAGALNPNSRPRAEDLAATCCSMSVNAVEPDAALWARMREIREGLGPIW